MNSLTELFVDLGPSVHAMGCSWHLIGHDAVESSAHAMCGTLPRTIQGMSTRLHGIMSSKIQNNIYEFATITYEFAKYTYIYL